MQRAGRNQPVVAVNKVDDLRLVETVAFHRQRVDDDFHQFFACTDQVDFKDARQCFEFLLEILRDHRQGALRDVAGQVQYEHRVETRHLDLVDRGFLRFAGQLGLRKVDFFPNVLECLLGVDAGIEFKLDVGAAFVGVGDHLLDALDGSQLLFHRSHQQALGVLGRNAVVLDAHVNNGNFDVRLGFLGNRRIGDDPADQDDQQ